MLLQAVPRLRHIRDPGATDESADESAPGLEDRLLALGVCVCWGGGIIRTVGTPLPLGTGPGLRPTGWEVDGLPGGYWRRRNVVHAFGSCGRSSSGQVPRGQTRPGGCKPQAKVEKGRSLPTNPFYTVKTAGLSPKRQLFNLEARGGKKLTYEHTSFPPFLTVKSHKTPLPHSSNTFQQKSYLSVKQGK